MFRLHLIARDRAKPPLNLRRFIPRQFSSHRLTPASAWKRRKGHTTALAAYSGTQGYFISDTYFFRRPRPQSEPLRLALKTENYLKPTPIQQAIRFSPKAGDLLGIAQTGTGKTAPSRCRSCTASQSDARHARRDAHALILAPTRELCLQIDERFRAYGLNFTSARP